MPPVKHKTATLNKKIKAIQDWLISIDFIELNDHDLSKDNYFITRSNGVSIYSSVGIWSYLFTEEHYNKQIYYRWKAVFPQSSPVSGKRIDHEITLRTFKSIFIRSLPILNIIDTYYKLLEAAGFELSIKSSSVIKNSSLLMIKTDYQIDSCNGVYLTPSDITPQLTWTEYGTKNWFIDHLESDYERFKDSQILYNIKKFIKFSDRVRFIIFDTKSQSFKEQSEKIFHEMRGSINSRVFSL